MKNLPHPKPSFALGSHLDRLLDERALASASRRYRPYKPTEVPSELILIYNTKCNLFWCGLLLHKLWLLLGLRLGLVLGLVLVFCYGAT